MTGVDADLIARDPDSWAAEAADLTRIIHGQFDPAEEDAAGLAAWVAARWAGTVLLDTPTVEQWLADWGAKCLRRA